LKTAPGGFLFLETGECNGSYSHFRRNRRRCLGIGRGQCNPPVDEQDLAGLSIEELAQIEARSARQV
jgi:hypothetical protein